MILNEELLSDERFAHCSTKHQSEIISAATLRRASVQLPRTMTPNELQLEFVFNLRKSVPTG
jgi:hypothetical protein